MTSPARRMAVTVMNHEAEVTPPRTAAQTRLHLPSLQRWNLNGVETAMLAGILTLTVLVYLRCLANGFVSDDVLMILQNKPITHWSYLWKSLSRDLWWFNQPSDHPSLTSFYQPIQSIWLGLAYHLFGRDPVGWHLAKIGLHLGVVLLVFRLAQLLSKRNGVALLAAALFAVLPVHAEAVVWATDIPEPLSTAFELGALIVFIQRRRDRYWRGLAIPLALYAAAIFTHEAAVMFPALIAAYVLLFESDSSGAGDAAGAFKTYSPLWARIMTAARWSAPFAAVTFLYLCTRALVLGTGGVFGFLLLKQTAALARDKVVIRSLIVQHSPTEILLTIPGVALWYLGLLLFPWLPGPAHEAHFVTVPTLANFYGPLGAVVLVALAGYLAFRNSPHARLYALCAIWWVLTTLPGPLPGIRIGVDLIYDRYQYLPSFAFCLLLANMAVGFARDSVQRTRVVTAAAALVVIGYVVALWHLQPVWHDNVAMFSRAVSEVPDSAHYHQVLGTVLIQDDQLDNGTRELAYASRLAPEDYTIHYQLAAAYMRLNRGDDASKELAEFYRTVFAQKSAVQNITLPTIVLGPKPADPAPAPQGSNHP